MKKSYSSPEMEYTPVNTRDLMQTAAVSVGGAGDQNGFLAPDRKGIGAILMVLLMLMPMSMFAWNYTASGNVLSAYGESGYTASSPLSITINAPADLQFNGNYKPATISNTAAWTAAGLTVPTILYDGKTNAPSMLGTYAATISAGGATAEVVYTIKSVIDYKSFFHDGLTQGINCDIVPGHGTDTVDLNNPDQRGVYWDPVEHCAVFDGEAYLQIDNPLGNVTAETGFTLTMDVWISSDNRESNTEYIYRSTGAYVRKSGWQRLFDLSDGHEEDCIFINAGNASNGTAHLMWCLRKGYNTGESYKANNTGRSYWNQWCTLTLVVAPGGYTTLYVNGEMLTHSISSDISKIITVLNSIHEFDKCFIGTSIFEAGGGNPDGFFFGKIRGFQTAEGALMPYYDGSSYHYLLSYETNGGNPITGTFEATIPTTLPTPTHPTPGALFQGWYMDEDLTIPVTTGVALTKNTPLYAKWNYTVEMAEGTEDVARWTISPTSAPEGTTITVDYIGSKTVESVSVHKKYEHTYVVNTPSEMASQVAAFNADEGSRLLFNTDITDDRVIITANEGVIDLNGHSLWIVRMQNNALDRSVTIMNGTITNCLDGQGGWDDYFKGTVIVENLTVCQDIWTDGHLYYLYSGTFNRIQNYTKGDAPGMTVLYDGATYTALNTKSKPSGVLNGTYIYPGSAPVLQGYGDVVVVEQDGQWTFPMPAYNAEVAVSYTDFQGHGTEDDPYLIPSLEVWNKLATNVNAGKSYDGKYFLQTADISGVTNMIGGVYYDETFKFGGIYDGGGHTLTMNISSTAASAAPFSYVNNATIKNLRTAGTNSGSGQFKTGLVGHTYGTVVIRNCISSVTITTSTTTNTGVAGIAGLQENGSLTIDGCAFIGSMAGGNNRTACAGIMNWTRNNGAISITNCLFAPSSVSFSATNTATICRSTGVVINNCYYLTQMGTAQGEHAYSVTAGTDVTMTSAGTSTATYDVSGLTFYGTNGFTFDDLLYGGNGDAISMNLTHADAPVGHSFSTYSADHGTLTGSDNPYTLTMANANAVIDANYAINQYTITFNSNGGSAVNPITQDYNTAITAPADPTRDFYAFTGWSPALPATMPAEDIELTAQWVVAPVTLNETDADLTSKLTALDDGTPHDITIGRTIVAGPYNTCCLPFDLSASQIATSPLAGATLKDYDGADVTGEGAGRNLNIYLTDLTEIIAGKPFLIKTETEIVNLTFMGVTVTWNGAMGALVERDHVDFQGILAPYDLAYYSNSSPDYLGIGADGRLRWADGSLSTGLMRGFRAFFHVTDAGQAGSPVRRGMNAQFVDGGHRVPTAVDNTANGQPKVQKVIRDGEVLIIRDGKQYNALGAEVK